MELATNETDASAVVHTADGTANPNHATLESVLKDARKLGRIKGKGDDSLSMLAIRVVTAAEQGSIDLGKDKHGEGIDDAKAIYTAFAEGRADESVHERDAGSMKAQISKLRVFVKLGVMTSVDPVVTMDDAVRIHQELVKDPNETVKGAYASYIDVARAQLDSETQLTEDEIKDLCRKGEKAQPELEKILKQTMDKLAKVISGEAGVKDQSDEIVTAHDAIKARLTTLLVSKEQDEARKALELAQARAAKAGVQ